MFVRLVVLLGVNRARRDLRLAHRHSSCRMRLVRNDQCDICHAVVFRWNRNGTGCLLGRRQHQHQSTDRHADCCRADVHDHSSRSSASRQCRRSAWSRRLSTTRRALPGSVPVTGWALDDVKVVSVKVYRDTVAGEPAGSLVYIGDATFVPGARPDVAAAYPTIPFNTRAGWGYLLLTNTLPNRGTGTYRLSIYATDQEGNQQLLGIRTIICSNSTATVPFGAIDTPAQGEVVSSATVNNFGWVLSLGRARRSSGRRHRARDRRWECDRQPVWLDESCGHFRALPRERVPGREHGAWRAHIQHEQDLPRACIRSRGASPTTWVGWPVSAADTSVFPPRRRTRHWPQRRPFNPLRPIRFRPRSLRGVITGRRGFSLDSPLRRFAPDSSGVVTIQGEEVDRFELHLSGQPVSKAHTPVTCVRAVCFGRSRSAHRWIRPAVSSAGSLALVSSDRMISCSSDRATHVRQVARTSASC